MKTAISIPDNLFSAADRIAGRLGLSRNQFYQRAIAAYVAAQDEATAANEAAAEEKPTNHRPAGRLDPVFKALQIATLPRDEW